MKNENEIIAKIREFNRFYTNVIGLLDNHLLRSPYTLTEARVLYEIYNTNECTARQIKEKISIDEGYLSRIIDRFVKNKLLLRKRSSNDARSKILTLTTKGEAEFLKLDKSSQESIEVMLKEISETESEKLAGMMTDIMKILSK